MEISNTRKISLILLQNDHCATGKIVNLDERGDKEME